MVCSQLDKERDKGKDKYIEKGKDKYIDEAKEKYKDKGKDKDKGKGKQKDKDPRQREREVFGSFRCKALVLYWFSACVLCLDYTE